MRVHTPCYTAARELQRGRGLGVGVLVSCFLSTEQSQAFTLRLSVPVAQVQLPGEPRIRDRRRVAVMGKEAVRRYFSASKSTNPKPQTPAPSPRHFRLALRLTAFDSPCFALTPFARRCLNGLCDQLRFPG